MREWMRSIRGVATAALCCAIAACSANVQPDAPQAAALHQRPHDANGSLHWLSSDGLGIATADCGGQWVAIAGGASSSSATDIGDGFPGPAASQWEALSSGSTDRITAYALCAPEQGLSNNFYRVSVRATKKHPSPVAACNGGDMLLAGWGSDIKWEAPVLTKGKATGWTAGGYTGSRANAECVTATVWTTTGMSAITKTAGGGRLYLACPGGAGDVLGGFYGSGKGSSAGAGPPQSEYPGLANGGGSINPTGMWFTAKTSMTGVAICQQDV